MRNTALLVRVCCVLCAVVFICCGCGKNNEDLTPEKKAEQKEKLPTPSITSIDKPLAPDGFKAELIVEKPQGSVAAQKTITIPVTVVNKSKILWPAKGLTESNGSEKYTINLSYNIYDKEGNHISEGNRTPLPHDLNPQSKIILNAIVTAPEKPGDYIIEFDMVQEGVAWFATAGSTAVKVPMRVE
jgi:hypothetical protein